MASLQRTRIAMASLQRTRIAMASLRSLGKASPLRRAPRSFPFPDLLLPLTGAVHIPFRRYPGAVMSRKEETDEAADELPPGLRRELLPKHVAVIMDGNGRWAKSRGLQASFGHQAGVKALRMLVSLCTKWGIRVLTAFAFSTDNWIRSKIEVAFLMSLIERTLRSQLERFARDNIRISVIGDNSKIPASLLKTIGEIQEATRSNTGLHFILAIGYSGKYDLRQACQSIARKVKDETLQVSDINERLIEDELETNCAEFPCPDLLIRTSGELRVSNFMLWQLAYTELFFAKSFWPDFGKDDFVEALTSFQQRQRRFGARRQ